MTTDKSDQVDNDEKRRRISGAPRVSPTRNNRPRERTDVEPTSVAAADATAAADAMDTATVSDDRATADAVVACDHNDHDSGGDQTTLYHDGE